MPVQENRQQLLMEIEMFRMPKPTIVLALVGTSLAALAASSVPSFAAPTTCAGDLRLTRMELRDTPDGQHKNEAMGLYSSAINAYDNGQQRQCLGDLNKAGTVLASTSMYPFDPGNVGVVDPPSNAGHHQGEHDHDHDHGHDHGHGRG
ncbi:hypothetical protein [Rhizobium lusitanum]|uniref:hypothetical protein n=1 Tax=Rhizobium lusitanum TaxID=293958 RepID=UPI001FEFAA0D|nr:hypothetical protein [Rhizobium lusitanum]